MTFYTTTHATLPSCRRKGGLSLSHMLNVWRERQQLKRLDDAALEDLGLSYRAALRESKRPVWDVPAYWCK